MKEFRARVDNDTEEYWRFQRIQRKLLPLLGHKLYVTDGQCGKRNWKRVPQPDDALIAWSSSLARFCEARNTNLIAITIQETDRPDWRRLYDFKPTQETLGRVIFEMAGFMYAVLDKDFSFLITVHPPDYLVLSAEDSVVLDLTGQTAEELAEEFRQDALDEYKRGYQGLLPIGESVTLL